ncbi:polyprotein [Phytophthora megakarya]|uniref:Polyprotein n=1 Tax=Phytophthora megakarya TaxID=4795 RepID=A0A225WL83_9STRA|nr:polyprotein [Phytophthora megakarya]
MLWGEAAQHVVYTLNVTLTRVLGGLAPHQKLSSVQPDVSCLKTWGSLCYYHIARLSRSKKKKLSSRMGTSTFFGYSPSTHGYQVMDLASGAISTQRGGNLVFAENYTMGGEYVKLLLENAYLYGANALPSRAPLVPMLMLIDDEVKLDYVRESVLVQPETLQRATETSLRVSEVTPANWVKETSCPRTSEATIPVPVSVGDTRGTLSLASGGSESSLRVLEIWMFIMLLKNGSSRCKEL